METILAVLPYPPESRQYMDQAFWSLSRRYSTCGNIFGGLASLTDRYWEVKFLDMLKGLQGVGLLGRTSSGLALCSGLQGLVNSAWGD